MQTINHDNGRFPLNATWKNEEHEKPVVLLGILGMKDRETYYQSDIGVGIKSSELDFEKPNPPYVLFAFDALSRFG